MDKLFRNLIFKNTFWLLIANIGVKLATFFYTIVLARYLGVSNYGLYIYALTTFGLVSSIADLGLGRFLIRELAKDQQKIQTYLGNSISASLIAAVGIYTLTFILFLLFDPQIQRAQVALLMLLAVIPNSLIVIFQSIFTAIEKMKLIAISMALLTGLNILIGVFLVFLKLDLTAIVLAFTTAHIIVLAVDYYLLKQLNLKVLPLFDFAFIKKALKSSLPYGILTIIGLVYFRIDVILLSFIKGNEITGYYGAAFRFLDAVHFIPLALSTAIFPLMSRLHKNSVEELKKIYFKIIFVSLIISIPVVIFIFFGSGFLIETLYGQNYSPAQTALKILVFTIPFMFMHVPGAHLLFASEKFLFNVVVLSLTTVSFNIIGNLILIPRYDLVGASIMTVLSEIVSFAVFFGLIYFKVFGTKHGPSTS